MKPTETGFMVAPASAEGLYSGIGQQLDTYSIVGTRTKRVTRTLAELLDEVHAPQNVDFLSLDTEGSELSILSTFPWHRR